MPTDASGVFEILPAMLIVLRSLYSAANDPRPQMIPRPQMTANDTEPQVIPDVNRK